MPSSGYRHQPIRWLPWIFEGRGSHTSPQFGHNSIHIQPWYIKDISPPHRTYSRNRFSLFPGIHPPPQYPEPFHPSEPTFLRKLGIIRFSHGTLSKQPASPPDLTAPCTTKIDSHYFQASMRRITLNLRPLTSGNWANFMSHPRLGAERFLDILYTLKKYFRMFVWY